MRLIFNEEVIEMPRYEARRRRVLADDVNHILAVEVSALAEERLFAVVVVFAEVFELPIKASVGPDRIAGYPRRVKRRVAYRPAGEGTGALAHVVFGVVAHAHGEQFKDFAAVIFVDSVLMVVFVVEPENHCRVAGKLDEKVAEAPQSFPAEHLDLLEYCLGLVELSVSCGKDVMPEERYFLFQRATGVNHAVEPVSLAAFHVDETVLVDVVAPYEIFIFEGRWCVLRMKQFFDSCFVALRGVAFKFPTACAKSGAAQQMRHQREICVSHGVLPLLRYTLRYRPNTLMCPIILNAVRWLNRKAVAVPPGRCGLHSPGRGGEAA